MSLTWSWSRLSPLGIVVRSLAPNLSEFSFSVQSRFWDPSSSEKTQTKWQNHDNYPCSIISLLLSKTVYTFTQMSAQHSFQCSIKVIKSQNVPFDPYHTTDMGQTDLPLWNQATSNWLGSTMLSKKLFNRKSVLETRSMLQSEWINLSTTWSVYLRT